jgi:hypothetical protein
MCPAAQPVPPLRGCCDRILIVLFHRQNSFPVATQSLKARSTISQLKLTTAPPPTPSRRIKDLAKKALQIIDAKRLTKSYLKQKDLRAAAGSQKLSVVSSQMSVVRVHCMI